MISEFSPTYMVILNNYKQHQPRNVLNVPLFLDKPLTLFLKLFPILKKKKIITFFRYILSADVFVFLHSLNYKRFMFLNKLISRLIKPFLFNMPHNYKTLYSLSLKATAGLIRIFRFLRGYRSKGQSNRRPKHYFKNRNLFYKKNLYFRYNNFFNFFIPSYHDHLFFFNTLSKQALKLQHDQNIVYERR